MKYQRPPVHLLGSSHFSVEMVGGMVPTRCLSGPHVQNGDNVILKGYIWLRAFPDNDRCISSNEHVPAIRNGYLQLGAIATYPRFSLLRLLHPHFELSRCIFGDAIPSLTLCPYSFEKSRATAYGRVTASPRCICLHKISCFMSYIKTISLSRYDMPTTPITLIHHVLTRLWVTA